LGTNILAYLTLTKSIIISQSVCLKRALKM
jgi:hypothetical protein